jgi:hypothetical protein
MDAGQHCVDARTDREDRPDDRANSDENTLAMAREIAAARRAVNNRQHERDGEIDADR